MADEVKEEKEVKEEETKSTDKDEFGAAFEEALKEDLPVVKVAEEKKETKEEGKPEEKKEDEVKEEEKKEEKAKEEVTDYKAMYEAEKQKTSSWQGRITAANKKAEVEATARADAEKKLQEAQKSTQAKETEKDSSQSGDDDDKILKEFVEEFPSLEKPMQVMAKRIAQKLVEKSIKDIEPKIQKIEAIEKAVEKNQDEAHYEEIGKTHKDWKTIRDSGNLTKWIEAQPKIVRTSFERVVKQGTADEVVEMFDLYKESNGIKEESKPVEKREQIPKKKVEDLLAVESGASGNPKGKGKIGMDDFNASWEEALRQP